jgi:hypothetical protein
MQRRPHFFMEKLTHRPSMNSLITIAQPSQAKAFGIFAIRPFLLLLLDFHKLRDTLLNGHKSRRFIDLLIFENILLSTLLHLDIDQHQCVKAALPILLYFLVETVGLPFLGPKWDGDHLAESIHLQSAAANCTDDAGVVDHLNVDA